MFPTITMQLIKQPSAGNLRHGQIYNRWNIAAGFSWAGKESLSIRWSTCNPVFTYGHEVWIATEIYSGYITMGFLCRVWYRGWVIFRVRTRNTNIWIRAHPKHSPETTAQKWMDALKWLCRGTVKYKYTYTNSFTLCFPSLWSETLNKLQHKVSDKYVAESALAAVRRHCNKASLLRLDHVRAGSTGCCWIKLSGPERIRDNSDVSDRQLYSMYSPQYY